MSEELFDRLIGALEFQPDDTPWAGCLAQHPRVFVALAMGPNDTTPYTPFMEPGMTNPKGSPARFR